MDEVFNRMIENREKTVMKRIRGISEDMVDRSKILPY